MAASLWKFAVGKGRNVGWLFFRTSCQVNGSIIMLNIFHLFPRPTLYLPLCPGRLARMNIPFPFSFQLGLANGEPWQKTRGREKRKVKVFIHRAQPNGFTSSWLHQGHCSSYCGLFQITLPFQVLKITLLGPKAVNRSADSNFHFLDYPFDFHYTPAVLCK